MKKIICIYSLISAFNLTSQVWFDFGLNGSVGSGFYMGKSFYSDSRFNVVPQLNNTVALKVGVNPSEKHSVVIELGYANRAYAMDQALIPGKDENDVFTQQLFFSGFQGALLYRNTNEGSFIEVGPMINSISSQSLSDQASSLTSQPSFITDKSVRGVFGFGGYVLGSERVTLVAGLRFLYDFSDLRSINSDGELVSFPFYNYNEKTLNQPLHALDVQFNLELNVSLGFLARASCGKRKVVFEW